MKNRLGLALALTTFLALGGTALANTPRPAKTQNTGTTAGTMTSKSRKSTHRKHHRARKHRKSAANAHR